MRENTGKIGLRFTTRPRPGGSAGGWRMVPRCAGEGPRQEGAPLSEGLGKLAGLKIPRRKMRFM